MKEARKVSRVNSAHYMSIRALQILSGTLDSAFQRGGWCEDLYYTPVPLRYTKRERMLVANASHGLIPPDAMACDCDW